MATKTMERPSASGKKSDTIVDVIAAEHNRLRSLFDRLHAEKDASKKARNDLWAKTKKELLAHHEAEEESLFNALVQTSKDARHESLHAISEHGEHKKVIEQMEEMSPDDEDWDDKFEELRHDVFHHLEEEEEDVLPLVGDVLSDEKSRELGAKYLKIHQKEMDD